MATHPVFLPEESHGQGSLAGYSPCGCNESDTGERLVSTAHNTPERRTITQTQRSSVPRQMGLLWWCCDDICLVMTHQGTTTKTASAHHTRKHTTALYVIPFVYLCRCVHSLYTHTHTHIEHILVTLKQLRLYVEKGKCYVILWRRRQDKD